MLPNPVKVSFRSGWKQGPSTCVHVQKCASKGIGRQGTVLKHEVSVVTVAVVTVC